MPRYFLEVSYNGLNYSGFQIQKNAPSVQAEVERAFGVFFRRAISMTGSSRTDRGVHALQNFFHFDLEEPAPPGCLYHINAILPGDIVARGLFRVADNAHCRFDATAREYKYFIYREKDPFVADRAYFFPYKLELGLLKEAAAIIPRHHDFTSFSKRNTQVKTFLCSVEQSEWQETVNGLVYRVRANRFLRGMVRGLVGTMLRVGRGKLSLSEFDDIIGSRDGNRADFSVPGHGLFLFRVSFPDSMAGVGGSSEAES
ncbi:MAG: tRNA pseudouridine(38-40) synthase TruA [Puia sp.]|nr:tRNA pseudouridine(38-40) synthase TruA [Puia sp.]